MDRSTQLYDRYLQGDDDALEQLVILYSDAIVGYAYCFLHDFCAAEDVMEDTFAALIVKRKRFVSRSPFEAYLFRIARNKCIDRLRKAKRETSLTDDMAFRAGASIEDDVLRSVRDEGVYKALLTLPRDYRSALYLTYYRGFTVDEVCAALRKTKKQVYNLLSRAKAALKEILLKEGIDRENI